MRAVICNEFAPYKTLQIGEMDDPVPVDGQIVIDIKAAGVNFPDILLVEGKYQMKPPTPFIPGGECAGVVSAVGDKVQGFKAGDRVIAATLLSAFADKVAVYATQAAPMPDSMPFEEGAALITTYATTIHALKQRAELKAGESLVVLGAGGGVGTAAVQLGKALGAKVIAAARGADKLAAARKAGADETIDYDAEDLKARIKELTGGEGADVVYDAVGSHYSEAALRATRWGARFLVVGFAAGDIPKIPLNLALLNSRDIRGVFWGAWAAHDPKGNAANMAELFRLYEAGKIKPMVSATYPLEDVTKAFDDLMARKVTGKAVLTL
ncbi:NADPH:quinone oxidoreductase family protein [Hyphobacterium marinum]|uniref:NADPH:quinone oxidoreductase family protein n=1 Tax=Hyphobacterium marinum TaxID=3116574 RepID=A0ABU7M154_9PROT|nr:NADPH:quinone oxidoreductase family protein [Hyphobacterium sp. Y6023]MEE2567130.1 NADPH:quinone oxidoreductase family protein [Hyphobacterium sp. Y6023]